MARVITFGQQPLSAPAGTFREIHFPNLMSVDEGTQENWLSRLFTSDGANSRDLPRTISMQYVDDEGHLRSVPAGALHEFTVNGETKRASGKGWLVDSADGHLAEIMVLSQALSHNSADIADVPPGGIELIPHGDPWDDDFQLEVRFNAWSLGKTTLVAMPAFSNAHGVLADEVTAALGGPEPLVVECPNFASASLAVEIVAGMAALPSWDYFHRKESDIPHKVILGTKDASGWMPVYGHLGIWDVPHAGYDGQSRYIPRPQREYREFNQPGVLTDRGQVETGPIVLFGGHVDLRAAAGDPRNAWADVKVHVGKHGPWVCGVVRPHVSDSDAETYIARASRLSGHWKGNDLKMIISCSSEGFNVPGVGFEPGEPDEMVASFVPPPPKALLSLDELSGDAQTEILDWARARLAAGPPLNGLTATTASDITHSTEPVEDEHDEHYEARMARLAEWDAEGI